MAKKTYIATSRIDNIGGKVIEAGDSVQLDDKVAQPFVDGGSLKTKTSEDKAPDSEPT